MADIADVEKSLIATVINGLLPGVSYSSGAYASSSVTGSVLTIYRGWPVQNILTADLAAGKTHITLYADPGMSTLVSRYAPVWVQICATNPTITATVSGNNVTFAGAAGIGQVIGVQYGTGPAPSTAAYRILTTDTLTTAVAALAAKVAGATSSGAVLTLPGHPYLISGAVGADQTTIREVRRQTQGIRFACFCPTPYARDVVSGALDTVLAGLTDTNGNLTQFITLGDGSSARVRYRASYSPDNTSKDALWRRDLCFTVEYATTQTATQPVMLFNTLINATARNPLAETLGTFTA